MLIPSSLALFVGLVVAGVVAAMDWYVWGLNLAVNPRQPRHPVPLTGLELVDLGLRRLIAANQAVLPRAAFGTVYAKGGPLATDPDDGFKRVA
jgi:hypothetical protein